MVKEQTSGSWIARALASGMLKWLAYQLAAIIGPVLFGVATALVGRIGDGTPWMWSMAAGALGFGGCAAGAFFLSVIVARQRVSAKLGLAGPRFAFDITSKDVILGVSLQSTAQIPLEFEIKEIRTQLGDAYPPSRPFTNTVFNVPPGGQGWFFDHPIPVARGGGHEKTVNGTVTAKIAYGRPGSRKHLLDAKWLVHLRFDETGNSFTATWQDLA